MSLINHDARLFDFLAKSISYVYVWDDDSGDAAATNRAPETGV